MLAAFALVFIVLPLVEIFVIVQVGQVIGPWWTIALLLAVSVVGAWLSKHEGLGVWRRLRAQLNAGRVPGNELIDGFLILVAGLLLLTPGFVTDAFGILLLLPPTRAGLRRLLTRRFRLVIAGADGVGTVIRSRRNGSGPSDDVIDV